MGKCRIVRDNRAQVKTAIRAKVGDALAKAAHDMEAQAKANAPVDKGFLRASIRAEKIGPLKWRISVGASYGIYVELGTRFKGARPFLLPAFFGVIPPLRAAMRKILGR